MKVARLLFKALRLVVFSGSLAYRAQPAVSPGLLMKIPRLPGQLQRGHMAGLRPLAVADRQKCLPGAIERICFTHCVADLPVEGQRVLVVPGGLFEAAF